MDSSRCTHRINSFYAPFISDNNYHFLRILYEGKKRPMLRSHLSLSCPYVHLWTNIWNSIVSHFHYIPQRNSLQKVVKRTRVLWKLYSDRYTLRVYMNFFMYFLYYLTDMGEVWYRRFPYSHWVVESFVKIGALTATLMGINDLSFPSGTSWPRTNFTLQCILLVYIFEGINRILPLFAKYDIQFLKKMVQEKSTKIY